MPIYRTGKGGLLLFIMLIVSVFPVMGQDAEKSHESVFFFAPLAEYSFYGKEDMAVGGGFITGADGLVAIGLSGKYFHKVYQTQYNERILALEITMFLRTYLRYRNPTTGPYLQLNFGPLLLFQEDDISIPAVSGAASASLSFGWRFPFGKYFFVEPSVRAGYPFIVGGNIALGFRL